MDLKQAYVLQRLQERKPADQSAPTALPADAGVIMMAAMLNTLQSIDNRLGGIPRQTPG